MSDPTPTPGQRKTQNARAAYAVQFPSPEAKTEHYRALGKQAAARRRVLSGEEDAALSAAYELLGRIARRDCSDGPEPTGRHPPNGSATDTEKAAGGTGGLAGGEC